MIKHENYSLSTSNSTANRAAAPKPTLAFKDAIAIIVGIVIGAGIFETPALVAANVTSEGCWALERNSGNGNNFGAVVLWRLVGSGTFSEAT
ncbi:hypothetical protein [Coleofasciculus sp.]|uniref:hypothetical protein n=1 Tax=Coleofasciculus sp. TaxID=3100458 RepID=UPI003A2E1CB3